jgi:hypothetical protein
MVIGFSSDTGLDYRLILGLFALNGTRSNDHLVFQRFGLNDFHRFGLKA